MVAWISRTDVKNCDPYNAWHDMFASILWTFFTVLAVVTNDNNNGTNGNITSNILKVVDDAKVFRRVNTDGDKQHLQSALDKLVKWSEKWQMLLNFGKCKCLHTGHRNLDINYQMGDSVLGTTVKRKGLRGNNKC